MRVIRRIWRTNFPLPLNGQFLSYTPILEIYGVFVAQIDVSLGFWPAFSNLRVLVTCSSKDNVNTFAALTLLATLKQ